MATQKGTVGAVFGLPGSPVLSVGTSVFSVLKTYNYSREADTKDALSDSGNLTLRAIYNKRERMSVDILVDGSDQADALSAFITLPAVGDVVELTTTSGDTQIETSGDASNEWRVDSASKVASQDDFAVMTLGLVRWTNDLDDVPAS